MINDYPIICARGPSITVITPWNNNYMYFMIFMIRTVKNYKLLGDNVMARLPEKNCKLSPKFIGPRCVLRLCIVTKNEVYDTVLFKNKIVLSDRLKVTQASGDASSDNRAAMSIADGNETLLTYQPIHIIFVHVIKNLCIMVQMMMNRELIISLWGNSSFLSTFVPED